jgi:hypothetical protein
MSQFFVETTSGNLPPSVPTSFPTDSGTAIPVANVLNVVTPGGGTQGIMTTGAGNTITISLTDSVLTGTATTVGATTANINVLIPAPTSNSTVNIRASVAGYDQTTGLAVGAEMIGTVVNNAGVVHVIGTPDVTKNNDLGLALTNVDLSVSGTNVQVRVLGVAGKTIQWRAVIDAVTAP